MHTTHSSSHWGVSTIVAPPQDRGTHSAIFWADTPPEQTPPGADMPWEQTPPPPSRHLPVDRILLTHACENITLPQTVIMRVVKIILNAPVYNNAVTDRGISRPSLI